MSKNDGIRDRSFSRKVVWDKPWKNPELLCHDLPTAPDPGIGKILVTGATGYIGGRLVPELLARGYTVRAMVRGTAPSYQTLWPNAEIAVVDALDRSGLYEALDGVSAAYYLIHSMLLGKKEFAKADIEAASNFRSVAEETGLQRIIYLGGLGDLSSRSEHLRSRVQVAKELSRGSVPVTILRAAAIIGSGSASYEIIKHIVLRLPIVPVPYWARNKCQPISIRDVIKYLVGVLETPGTIGRTFDIGGGDILSYETMAKSMAEVLQKKRRFTSVPFGNIRILSYLASLITPVPGAITRCLMEGIKDDVVCSDLSIRELIPFELQGYKLALVRALTREEQDRVHTRWSDAYPPSHELAMKLHELEELPAYTVTYSIRTSKGAASLFRSMCRIGGREGWFRGNWMWRVRGLFDRVLLGVGTLRGRRHAGTLEVNDVVDFWRVEDVKSNERLLLRAEMKLPGKAWLEMTITDLGRERMLSVTPYYHTKSLFGRLYWYIFLPFHHFIFTGLIKQIEEKSRESDGG